MYDKPVSYNHQVMESTVVLNQGPDIISHVYSHCPGSIEISIELLDISSNIVQKKVTSIILQSGWNAIPLIPRYMKMLNITVNVRQSHSLDKNYFILRAWVLPNEKRISLQDTADKLC